jgi:Capsule polysaccharide biosynthesis protein
MSPFEEMATAFQDHAKMWNEPPACEASKGRYFILVCNWLATSVPFFSAELACALRHEGCEVTILWDSARVGVAAPSQEETKVIDDTIRTLPPWLNVVEVRGPSMAMPPALAANVDKIFRENTVWFAKGEVAASELLKSKTAEREEFLNHAAVVLSCLQSRGSGRLIVPGGVFGLSGIYLACAAHLGLPVSTYDMGRGCIMVSHDGCAAHRADFKTAYARAKEVVDHDPGLAAYVWQAATDAFNNRKAGKDQLRIQKISGSRETRYDCDVLVCLNYRADTSALNRERLFDSVADWLSSINMWSLRNPQYRIYIRQHPAERFDWVRNEENYPEMIRNWDPTARRLVLVDAQSDINTYDLLRSCRAVLPYTSTIGLEAAYEGKPVITSTKCYYAGIGFTWDPDSLEAYFDLLEKCLDGQISTPRPDSSQLAALSYLIVLSGGSLPTRFLPDDCRSWARASPHSLWNETAQKILIDCLINSTPLAYLLWLKLLRNGDLSKGKFRRTIEWMLTRMLQKS